MKRKLITAISVLLCACADSPTAIPDLRIAVVGGAEQTGGFGAELEPVQVRVTAASGEPVAGEPVTWHVVAGGGRTDSVTTRTDSLGIARVRWTLGGDEGTHLLVAATRSASISVTAIGRFEFRSVSVGFRHACAVSTTGEAFCWGSNSSGQLGNGTQTSREAPSAVLGNKRFLSISAGWAHTCGVAASGQIFCWGNNQEGQLGIGSSVSRSHAPTQVETTQGFRSVSAGFIHTCAIAMDYRMYCWGSNGEGQLGSATAIGSSRPVAANIAVDFRSVQSGEFHSCGVASDSALYCWGSNSSGQLGIGAFGGTRNIPTRVAGLMSIAHVATGARHTCAAGGKVFCWGRNALGEIGLPALQHAAVPNEIATDQAFAVLGAGNVLSCGANSQGAFCWGGDSFRSSVKPEIRFTGPVRSLGVGFEQTCVVSRGEIFCWGATSRDPVKVERAK